MMTFAEYKKELMKDPKFVEEWEKFQPELNIIKAMIEARTKEDLTQAQLAEKTGISLADIIRLENGTRNPSIRLLQRLAEGMNRKLKIEFVPK